MYKQAGQTPDYEQVNLHLTAAQRRGLLDYARERGWNGPVAVLGYVAFNVRRDTGQTFADWFAESNRVIDAKYGKEARIEGPIRDFSSMPEFLKSERRKRIDQETQAPLDFLVLGLVEKARRETRAR